MKYDFVEIGTSDFNSLIETADENTVGISVEPIKQYLDNLPSKKNVLKLNLAVGPGNCSYETELFFIPESVIKEKNLPMWLKGCNSIESYHPQHIQLNLTHLVEKIKINQISIIELFEKYQIIELDHLKIDTEGLDCDLLISLGVFLSTQKRFNFPKKITFESNSLTDLRKLSLVLEMYKNFGYIKNRIGKQDLELFKEN